LVDSQQKPNHSGTS